MGTRRRSRGTETIDAEPDDAALRALERDVIAQIGGDEDSDRSTHVALVTGRARIALTNLCEGEDVRLAESKQARRREEFMRLMNLPPFSTPLTDIKEQDPVWHAIRTRIGGDAEDAIQAVFQEILETDLFLDSDLNLSLVDHFCRRASRKRAAMLRHTRREKTTAPQFLAEVAGAERYGQGGIEQEESAELRQIVLMLRNAFLLFVLFTPRTNVERLKTAWTSLLEEFLPDLLPTEVFPAGPAFATMKHRLRQKLEVLAHLVKWTGTPSADPGDAVLMAAIRKRAEGGKPPNEATFRRLAALIRVALHTGVWETVLVAHVAVGAFCRRGCLSPRQEVHFKINELFAGAPTQAAMMAVQRSLHWLERSSHLVRLRRLGRELNTSGLGFFTEAVWALVVLNIVSPAEIVALLHPLPHETAPLAAALVNFMAERKEATT